jgi:protein-disulfide isomerase
MTGTTSRRRRTYQAWWLIAALVIVLVAAACSGSEQTQADEDPALEIPADSEQTSPLPDSEDSDEEAAESDGTNPVPDPSSLGANASTSDPTFVTSAGLEMGFTEEGFPYRGSPEAPVTLIEYSDYACPFCGRYTSENVPALLEQYGLTGQVRFIFREFPLVSLHPTARVAHTAALCAGEQGAEIYWAVHDEIFVRQADWTNLADPIEFVARLAESVGTEMTAYQECVDSGRTDEVITAGIAEAQALGFNGTPSFQLLADGVDDPYTLVGAQSLAMFQGYLDALIAGEVPDGAQTAQASGEEQEPLGLPIWAERESGLQPDPDRPGVNLAGDHYKGDPDAPVVVIEFSDFECPFCRDHALDVQPVVDAALVDSGEVLWVFKHLPLDIHPSARVAAVAAECAGDQGQFWEMHDLLFAAVEQWAGEETDTDAPFFALADELGMNDSEFEQCFTSREALERVLADMSDAKGIISQAPSFVLIQGDRGTLMEGSLPADQFVTMLRARVEDEDGSG